MNRREFLLSGGAALAGCPVCLGGVAAPGRAERPRVIAAPQSRQVPSANIRDHLSREAGKITGAATRELPRANQWPQVMAARRRVFREMMGLDHWWTDSRTPPSVTVTGVVEREAYVIEKLYYESWPGLFVTANLYVPRRRAGRAPGVLYVCGHARDQKVHYQAHARRLAELGFVCLIAETIQLGETEGYHHGCYREGWWHWYSRGYTPAGIELLNGVRGLDLLAARPEVDPERLGVTGISGGGAVSWWIAAADERVRAAAPVCGTATLFSHVHDRTVDGHCDCMWWINTQRWDMADVGALMAPRPLLIGSADKDGIFTVESIRQVHEQLKRVYRHLGASANLRLVETPGGHSYHERSRTGIFSWFCRHLMGRDIAPGEVGDISTRPETRETAETLRVYVGGGPAGNRTATIQDDFWTPAVVPDIHSAADLRGHRERTVAKLRRTTFGAFPGKPSSLDVQVEYEFEEDAAGYRFAFTSEPDWRLHGQVLYRPPLPGNAPVLIGLRSPGEGRWDTRSFLLRLQAPWRRVALETRGVGETSWGEDLNWHVRRAAAWTGRTVASMRVWDVLRGIAAVRQLPGIDPKQVCLAARGEMCVVALYAALLDGGVHSVLLENPPATQNVAGEKDGRGAALEMLDCLRITDLAQVAGMLWPAELILLGKTPVTYDWAAELYQRLGEPGKVTRIADLSQWRPA